jgi:hypothetical protein
LSPRQHLFNKVLYLNASKRDIQHNRPFAQSAHSTISSALTQPLAMFNKGSLFYSHRGLSPNIAIFHSSFEITSYYLDHTEGLFGQFLPILATFYEVKITLKKVGTSRGSTVTYFQLLIQKCAHHFWSIFAN